MTEFSADETLEKLPAVLNGEGWVDQRAMLQVDLLRGGDRPDGTSHALNDALVGRGSVPRVINVATTVNGVALSNYKVDGVIVSTATGSTAVATCTGMAITVKLGRLGALFNGSYYVVRARHIYTLESGYHTEFDVERPWIGRV